MPFLSNIGLAPAANVPQPFAHERLGEHRGGRGPSPAMSFVFVATSFTS